MKNQNENNYLRELRLWLCASLKNSDAKLICENIKNVSESSKLIEELEEIKDALIQLIEKINTLQYNLYEKSCEKCEGGGKK